MSDAPEFQYADGCFCFCMDEIEVHIDEMTFDEYMHTYLVTHGIETRTQDHQLYERTKRELAHKDWKYVQNYADAKGPMVEEILARVRA